MAFNNLKPVSLRGRSVWLLAGGMLSISAIFEIPAAGAPDAETSVLFVHGEAGGREDTGGGKYSASTTFTDPDFGEDYVGEGSASVTNNGLPDLPSLHAYASASAGNPESTHASASFSDELNFAFDGSTPLSAPAVNVFTFNFHITGSLTGSSSAVLNVSYGSDNYGFTLIGSQTNYQFDVDSDALTYGAGGTGTIGGTFSAQLGATANNNTADSVANFSDTVELESVEAKDADGNAVAGVFTDDAEILFPANTELLFVPEPGSLGLFVPALLLLGFFGRKRFRTMG